LHHNSITTHIKEFIPNRWHVCAC